MVIYLDLVMLLNFAIDFLLLVGSNRLCGYTPSWGKTAVAAGLGSVYSGVCMLEGFAFLGNIFWRIVFLFLMSVIVFGFSKSGLRRGVVFLFLSMALGGVAVGMGNGSFLSLICSAAVVALMCWVGFRRHIGEARYIPVEISYGDTHVQLTALADTGNALRDPITGRPVLVVDFNTAHKLTGLTRQQLRTPIESIGVVGVPGLRLIPYCAVGQTGGMLLALWIKEVTIGRKKGDYLVAFAPNGLSRDGAYQALTGGIV